jgi:hypothetical protein
MIEIPPNRPFGMGLRVEHFLSRRTPPHRRGRGCRHCRSRLRSWSAPYSSSSPSSPSARSSQSSARSRVSFPLSRASRSRRNSWSGSTRFAPRFKPSASSTRHDLLALDDDRDQRGVGAHERLLPRDPVPDSARDQSRARGFVDQEPLRGCDVHELVGEVGADLAQEDARLGAPVNGVERDGPEHARQGGFPVLDGPSDRPSVGALSATRCGDLGWQRRGNGVHGALILRGK